MAHTPWLPDPFNETSMLNRRQLLAAGASAVAAPAFAQASPPVAQLNALMDDVFNQALDDSPELVTRLGFDKGPRAAAKAQLNDRSAAGHVAV